MCVCLLVFVFFLFVCFNIVLAKQNISTVQILTIGHQCVTSDRDHSFLHGQLLKLTHSVGILEE